MGDRSNIVIEDHRGKRVYLYSHWGGQSVIGAAIHGLESGRAQDAAYLARIVFEAMVGDDRGGETGYGISTEVQDNEHEILVLSEDGEAWFEDEDGNLLTGRVPHQKFLDVVLGQENWENEAEADCLYENIIPLLGGKA